MTYCCCCCTVVSTVRTASSIVVSTLLYNCDFGVSTSSLVDLACTVSESTAVLVGVASMELFCIGVVVFCVGTSRTPSPAAEVLFATDRCGMFSESVFAFVATYRLPSKLHHGRQIAAPTVLIINRKVISVNAKTKAGAQTSTRRGMNYSSPLS